MLAFDELHIKLWKYIKNYDEKWNVVNKFREEYGLREKKWVRKMPSKLARGKGVHIYEHEDLKFVLWFEVHGFALETNTKAIFWCDWTKGHISKFNRNLDKLYLVVIFGNTNLFCVVHPRYVRKWFEQEEHSRNKFYFKISPEPSGLRFVVNGAFQIFDGIIEDSFMNFYEMPTPKDVTSNIQREECYKMLLNSSERGKPKDIEIEPGPDL